MDALKTYFVRPLTAAAALSIGAAIGAAGSDALLSAAIAGQDVDDHVWVIDNPAFDNNVPATFENPVETYLTSTECALVDAEYGAGVCDPDTIAYDVRFYRMADGQRRTIVKLYPPLFLTARPPEE